jgi:hypothetical protein
MQKHTPYKELYDPCAHYVRGVLCFDKDKFTFTAYRTPYLTLNEKTWDSEQAFTEEYRQLIESRFSM